MSKLKIFVSYSWKDKLGSTVKTITNHLQNDGWDVWIDVHDLDHGQHINHTIGETLKEMDLVLFMWSENFAASAGCQYEAQTVLDFGIPFIPCQVSNCPKSNSLLFQGYKWLDFQTPAKGMSGVEWGWLQLRQQLLEMEAELYGNTQIQEEVHDIKIGVGELENTIYRMKQEASSNDHSDPFIQMMMKTAIQMAENDPENGEKYTTFCWLVSEISRMHPMQTEDRLKRQKLLGAVDLADPDGTLPVLQKLRMMTELSLLQA